MVLEKVYDELIAMIEDQKKLIANMQRGEKHLQLVDLGTEFTQELKDDISSGTFEKARVGGYLTLNNHVYLFAHADYWLHSGDTECVKHHMVVVPLLSSLASGKMNQTSTTTGGYINSDMRAGHDDTTDPDNPVHIDGAIEAIKTIIKTDFGAENILSHREYFSNAVANGAPSGGEWIASDIDLMNELMVYGSIIFTPMNNGSSTPNLFTNDKTQLELFARRPDLITTRGGWWLRDVVDSARFSIIGSSGFAAYLSAASSAGIRPVFAIYDGAANRSVEPLMPETRSSDPEEPEEPEEPKKTTRKSKSTK